MKFRQFLEKHPVVEQVLKFGIVGTSAFFIDTFVFWILIKYVNLNSYVAIALAFVASLFYNYFLSTRWVFEPKRSKGIGMLFVFTALSVIGLVLTEVIYGFIVSVFFKSILKLEISNLSELVSKVISSVIVMVYNFITRKIFLEGR